MKFTISTALLLFLTVVAMGQTPTQTNTQFPNPGFEAYQEHTSASSASNSYTNPKKVPYNWHTFDEANAAMTGLAALGNSTAKQNHHNYFTTGGKGGAYFEMICKSVLGIPANGALSCGRTKIASMTAASSSNYNYTDPATTSSFSTSGSFSWPFVGCPDSMSFYYKTQITNTSHQPLFKVFLHGNGEFRDRANGTLYGNSTTELIGCSVDTFSRHQDTTWQREVKAFMYTLPGQGGTEYTFLGQPAQVNAYGYYDSLCRPTYMLASFSTEKKAGTGTDGDKLAVDELYCIYDKGLNSLTINGAEQPSMLAAFNDAEFATHEPSRTYDADGNPSFNNNNGNTQYCSETIIFSTPIDSVVAATPKSKLITGFEITNPSIFYKLNPTSAVKVTHNDNSIFTYTIIFTDVKLAQPTANNDSRCGVGTVNLTASVPAGLLNPVVPAGYSDYTVTCKWYTTETGGTEVGTGTSYSPNVSANQTFYVSTYITYSYTDALGNSQTRTMESDRTAATVTVTDAPTVSLSANATQSACAGQAIESIAVNSANGTLNVTGLPTGVDFSGSAIVGSSNAAGEYPYIVVCSNEGCPSDTAAGVITVNASYNETQTVFISMLELPYTWREHTFDTSTTVGTHTYVYNESTVNGCDSVVTLNLTVNLPNMGDTVVVVCDNFDWYEYTNLTQSGDYTHVFSTDSVVTLHLTVNYSSTGDTTAVACGSFDWYEQTNLTQSGDYTRTISTLAGCDSVVTLHLTIAESEFVEISDTIDGSYQWHGETYTESGDYTWVGQTEYGCDSTVTLHLTITTGINVWNDKAEIKLWPNPARDIVHIQMEGINNQALSEIRVFDMFGQLILRKTAEGDQTELNLSDVANGIYTVSVISNGRVLRTLKVVKNTNN